MTVDELELEPLPALDVAGIEVDETQKVTREVGRLRSPQKRLPILARIAAEARDEADAHRNRRDELLLWLRWAGNRKGIRNLGFADAMGMVFTRPSVIWKTTAARLGYDLTSDTPPPVEPGTAPVGEFRHLSEQVHRAEVRRDAAIVLRDREIVKLRKQGMSRADIHRLAGGLFDPSLISQVVARAERGQ